MTGRDDAEAWRPRDVPGWGRVWWLGWICLGVGVLLAVVTALDLTTVANVFAFALGIAAHGCFAVFVVAFVRALNDRPRRDGRKRWDGAAIRWALNTFVLGYVLTVIDRFVLGLATSVVWKWLFGIAALVALGVVLVVEALLFFSSNHITRGMTRAIAEWIVVGVRGLALGFAVVLVAIGVFAWRNQRDVDDDSIPIPSVPISVDTYVALGDSYSAGEGLGPFLPGPRPGCHRSPDAFPLLLKFDAPADVRFRACSGAVTDDVDLGIVGGFERQIDHAPVPEVDLVTITIGGNDVIFSRVVQSCFLYEDCIEATFIPPKPNRAHPTVVYPDKAPFADWAEAAMLVLARNVDRVYANVSATYPNARIIVVGYPYLFSDRQAPWWPPSDCVTVLRRVDQSERVGLRALTDRLNETLYDRANEAGIEFVSPAAAWHKHDPCGTEGQYTRAVKPKPELFNPVDGGTFHPNQQGQRQLARLVTCYLIENPDGPPAFLSGSPPGSRLPAEVGDEPLSCKALLERGKT